LVSDGAVFNVNVPRAGQSPQTVAAARVWLDSDNRRTKSGETLGVFAEVSPDVEYQVATANEGRVKSAHLHAIDEFGPVENALVCGPNGEKEGTSIQTFTNRSFHLLFFFWHLDLWKRSIHSNLDLD
jgi:hypothetical protein